MMPASPVAAPKTLFDLWRLAGRGERRLHRVAQLLREFGADFFLRRTVGKIAKFARIGT